MNNRKDPGGATNMGIIQRTYDAYRKLIGLARRSVRYITPTERDTIYKTQFWDKVLGDRLPSGVDYAVYDFAVNSGVKRASEYLQR
ncbi:glycosyl hydrolase 108 family protein, partial [Sulfitobacter sp. HI0040]|uniref:glycosyl hydrolase 108 family protein n=1 Tax=Sulfitobacter sp. HI0040 TaxID=1822232 RepID=UPI002E7FE89F